MATLLPIALLLIWSVGGSVAEWSPQSSGGVCVASKYSSIDGSCNNVLHPDWGVAGSSFLRLLPPKYDERTPQNPPSENMMAFLKRISKKGHHEYVTSMLPVWAEMVKHDISTFVYDQGGIVNGATGFLDASPVYGNTQQENDNLRSPGQAELNLSACRICGQPGSGVGALLSTLVSEHNRLAGELGRFNPHWSPDTRHHEARRLVIAQLQHITYNEFLPTLLGEAMTNEWSLKPAKRGRFNGYSSSIRAGSFFSSALAPMLVTSAMIPHTMISMDAAPSNKTAEEIEDTLIETIAMILESPAQLPDLQRVGNLFRAGESSFHNSIELSHKRRLPRFPDWMNLCTGSNDFIDSFDELSTVQSDNRKLLAELYKNPNDVDLLVGGMVERVLPGSLMGPTFTCILANQFTKLRESDRYWYENDIPPTSFSKGNIILKGFFASIPDCRSCDSPITVHPECMPIHIPPGDPFYPQVNQTTGERFCLPFMRSLPGQQHLGPREQINQNSGYLDGSHIYGETACLARELRSYGGRLNVTVNTLQGKDLLPQSPSHPECRAPSGYCFIAGDGRASEQPALTAIHTIFMREHNRLVDGLRAVNVHWGDERLYQTARKINIATYQHILYNEFLPRLLGWNAVNLYGLKLNNQGYYQGYSNNCNPNVVTEFASAAFRIGHSLLRPHLPRMTPTYTPMEPVLLRDVFFNPDIIRQTQMVDELIRGLVSTPMENLDQFITGEITNHLFEEKRVPHSGMDLPALNIQRARDHGIPPYNEYRGLCNLKRATTWEDLSREIPNEVIARLRHIYPSVNDIDLFPGGLSERPLQGGLVGPTFACIIGLQFRQLRKCDRFWYESGDPLFRFTEAQLAEIRKSTLSKVLCDNMDIASDIQRSVLDQPSDFLNPRVPCNSIPHVDLNAWREPAEQGCQIAGRTVPVGDSALPTPCTSCVCTSEGAQCASLRVTDCDRLLREAGRDAILRDEVCAAQCSAVLLSSPGPTLEALEDVVSLTTSRPPTGLAPGATRGRQLFPPTNLRPPPPPSPFGGRNTHRTTRTWDFSI